MTGQGGTPSADEKAKKIKSLLQSYYTADHFPGEEESGARIEDPTNGSPCRTPSSVQSSQLSRAQSAATPLNTTYFNPDAYLKRTLKETRLADLTQKHRSLLAEVGSLDSDMQMLVYENYNKFVSATDTIKVMNSSMGSVVGDMNTLQHLIDGVVNCSNTVNSKLQQRQDSIEELNRVRVLLNKLQGVFDLPAKLRAAIEREAFDVAVDSYADVAPLLKKCGYKAAFRKVAQEVEVCGQELVGLLRKKMASHPDDAADCIAMIAKLGEPTVNLQEDFLKCKREQMEEWLQIAGVALKSSAVKSGLLDPSELGLVDESLQMKVRQWFPGAELPSLYTVLIELDSRFLSELTHTAAMYAELFEPGGRKRLVKVARDVFQRYLKLARRALSDAAAASAAAAAGISPTGELLQPLHHFVPSFREQALGGGQGLAAATVEAEAGVDGSIAIDWGAEGLVQALNVVKNDIARLDSMLPELNPKDRAWELVEHTVRQHVGLCFAALERRAMGSVAALQLELGTAARSGAVGLAGRHAMVQDGLLLLNQVILLGIDRLLLSLKGYEQERWVLHSWLDVFKSLVQGQLQNLYQSISMQLASLSQQAAPQAEPSSSQPSPGRIRDPSSASAITVDTTAPFAAISRRASLQQPTTPGGGEAPPPPPLLLLLLCRFLQNVERELVPHAHERVLELYVERRGRGGRGEDLPAFTATELGRHLSSSSKALLRGFVDSYGHLLTLAVERSMEVTDWVNHKEPRAPRPVCDYLLEKMTEADADIACVAEAGPASTPHSRGSSVHHHSHSSSGVGSTAYGARQEGNAATSMMEAAVAKVFSQGNGSNALELAREPLLCAILSQALVALVGCVRGSTLGRAGFQQVQLDVHYLRPRLQLYVADGGAEGREVMQLLDELLGAAMERCSQPLMLDTAVLDKIVAQATAQRAQQQQQSNLL